MNPLARCNGVAVAGRLQPTDLDVGRGELVGLIGLNGSGKTSLLRALCGIERTSGTVLVEGVELASQAPSVRRKLVSYLPTARDAAWPISVRDVIALGLSTRNDERVEELVRLLELGPVAARAINRLSTGERARVFLARALAPRSRLVLLDEPLSNLDPYWTVRIPEILRENVGEGCAILVSLHDLHQVSRFDRLILLEKGTVVADLPPAQLLAAGQLRSAFGIEPDLRGWQLVRSVNGPFASDEERAL